MQVGKQFKVDALNGRLAVRPTCRFHSNVNHYPHHRIILTQSCLFSTSRDSVGRRLYTVQRRATSISVHACLAFRSTASPYRCSLSAVMHELCSMHCPKQCSNMQVYSDCQLQLQPWLASHWRRAWSTAIVAGVSMPMLNNCLTVVQGSHTH